MQEVFLMIVSLLAAGYAVITRQFKTALGLLIVAISFIFVIPNLVFGIWVEVFQAIMLIIFAAGLIVIVYRKKEITKNASISGNESKEDEENKS